jgi:hypothetical protein
VIVVTGSKRSGTSMWMQVLAAAGFPLIGKAFPGVWGQSLRQANPHGFYESIFRRGVYFATNPDPRTGAFLSPKESREHVVKVFVPGLVRSDLAYLHRVLATVRNWRAYGPSLARLYAMEDEWYATRPLREGESEAQRAEMAERVRTSRGTLPAPVEWWMETYDLVRDALTRGYAFHVVSYERLLAAPDAEVARVIEWVGRGDVPAAVAAVERRAPSPVPEGLQGLTAEDAALFDELYTAIHTRGRLNRDLVARMNDAHPGIVARYAGIRRDAHVDTGLD